MIQRNFYEKSFKGSLTNDIRAKGAGGSLKEWCFNLIKSADRGWQGVQKLWRKTDVVYGRSLKNSSWMIISVELLSVEL